MKYLLTAICLSACGIVAAQVPYSELRPKLDEKSCTAPPSEDECRRSIRVIENWLQQNPTLAEPATFDDLRTYYYFLSAKDFVNRTAYMRQSVHYSLRYADAAPPKEKHFGYWNAAVGYFFLNDCENSLKYLHLAKTSPGAKKQYRDKGTEQGIKKACSVK